MFESFPRIVGVSCDVHYSDWGVLGVKVDMHFISGFGFFLFRWGNCPVRLVFYDLFGYTSAKRLYEWGITQEKKIALVI
jgi:hypothetical protein